MSIPEKADICVPDTQETYYEESNNEKTCSETQNTNLNESQDFRLVDLGEDESMTEKTQPSEEDICQKSTKESDLQQTSNTLEPKTDDKSITASDDKIESEAKITEEETTRENKLVKKSEEINDELTDNDEDEIIQGTPPHSYTPPKKADGDIEGASLKRKAESFEEPPAKVLRITSMESAIVDVKEKFVEEESIQSSKSDDSYDELFKSPKRNVIIEETQDPASQLPPNSPKSPTTPTETTDTCEEQQDKEKAFTEKCCDVEKDENLNVSAKVADTSADDSTVTNVNSLHEDDTQVEKCEMKETVTSSSPATENIDEKPQIDTSDKKETDEQSPEVKDTVADVVTNVITNVVTNVVTDADTVTDAVAITDTVVADKDGNTTDSVNCVEKAETESKKPTENDKEIPSSQPKVSNESQSCLKSASSCKSRTSVEFLYDGASRIATNDDSESKPEIVEIGDDTDKSILESSAEIIFDQIKNSETKSKPEVVNIDDSHEEREKIVLDRLDSNSEVTATEKSTADANETVYKSCYDSKSEFSYKSVLESKKESSVDSYTDSNKLVNGSDESKRDDRTVSIESDTFSNYETPSVVLSKDDSNNASTFSSRKLATKILSGSKDLDNIELISISDHEQDMSNTDDGVTKSDLIHNSALAKAVQVEKEIGMYVKLRCLLQVDENTKELLGKELTAVHCEPMIESALIRQKDDTASSSLADISDNKEASPGSVNSNPQTFHLNPSRLSIMSSVSSSSSASSAASLAAKLKESMLFSLPRGPAKHAKKMSQDVLTSMSEKQTLDETYERLTREWDNNRLLTMTVLNCANAELSTLDTYNISNERLDDHHLQKMHSSTPEVEEEKIELTTTPKSTKKSKSLKRPRSKMTRSRAHTNGESKNSANTPTTALDSITEDDNTPRKKSKMEINTVSDATKEAKLVISDADVLANSSPLPNDDLVGKKVFAKWSDNNYYPGTVADRVKTKYKVNFYDGKNKVLIPEFIIPIPKTIKEGLSVYATTQTNDYGSCGIIVDVKSGKNSEEDDVRYTVETDEGERLHVQVKDIFLSADQAQVLKEEVDSENNKSLPSTPKHLGQVSLDNMVEGKRRSKRIGTPVFSTPKTRNANSSSSNKTKPESLASGKTKKKQSSLSENESASSDMNTEPAVQDEYSSLGAQQKEIARPNYSTPKSRNANSSLSSKIKSEPSVSGIAAKTKKKRSVVSENESTSSDTNVELVMQDEYTLWGLQREIIDTPLKPNMKGLKHRVKGKFSKRTVEDEEMKKIYGSIPTDNTIFKGLSFILTCAPTDNLDRYHDGKTSASGTETETDNEAEWLKRPFVRERLQRQIIAGGGKVYEDFNEIPKDEYAITKHITNVPNTTAKSILCLSVGIPSYNHKWIIRCCLEEKLVNSAEEVLPTGWSLHRRAYMETFQMKIKPLSQLVVIIPHQLIDQQFSMFWSQVCDNAGAVVLVAESSENIEEMEFDSAAVIVSNQRCPAWAVEKAQQLRIPIMSTTWVIQCLIEGKICPYGQHSRYKYNYTN